MWAARSLAGAGALLLLAGCSDSKSNITAADLTRALRAQGFSATVANRSQTQRFARVIGQDIRDVDDVVAQSSAIAALRPGGRIAVGDLVFAALIYRHASDATCSHTNVIGACLTSATS